MPQFLMSKHSSFVALFCSVLLGFINGSSPDRRLVCFHNRVGSRDGPGGRDLLQALCLTVISLPTPWPPISSWDTPGEKKIRDVFS